MELIFQPTPVHTGTTVTTQLVKESDNELGTRLIYFVIQEPDETLASDAIVLRDPSVSFRWTPSRPGRVHVIVVEPRSEPGGDDASPLPAGPTQVERSRLLNTPVGEAIEIDIDARLIPFIVRFHEHVNVVGRSLSPGDLLRVELQPSIPARSRQAVLDEVIDHQTGRLTFESFDPVATEAVCQRTGRRGWFGESAYRALRDAALSFVDDARGDVPPELLADWGQYVGPDGTLPYIDRILPNATSRGLESCPPPLEFPGTELIWSYWMEEAMLVQSLNHILARFQNRRTGAQDPLARFDLNPLLPLRNLLWGFAEDEFRRLTVRRRAAEYRYEYGLALIGRAVPPGGEVESRTRFLESFHALLHIAARFYRDTNDTTIRPDPFPVLNALRETHLILAQGAHNQFADLPRRARAEMLAMQWILARPEMREFLGGRPSVPYQEPWMDRIDTMKSIHGWTDVSVTHFRDLAFFGEQLVLSIRLGDWNDAALPVEAADGWARFWRNAVQRYSHAYRAATGVDLVEQVDATMPATLLARRVRAARA